MSTNEYLPIDVATPSLNIRRKLPAVPPTPFEEDQRISQLLLNEDSSLPIVNTPSVQPSPRECRILPETPLDRSRQRSSSLPRITEITHKNPITNPRAPVANLPINHGVVETPTGTPVRRRMGTIRSLPNKSRSVILDVQGRPDYKKTAYLDCRSYAATLCSNNVLDRTVKEYLEGNADWNKVTEVIASEERAKVKKARTRKGPWIKNRRENRNTRKARIYQFTQKAYDQNKKATINKIVNGNFSLKNSEQVYPDIKEVENAYTKRLEEGNQIDLTDVEFPEDTHSDLYGKFTDNEVRECIRELRRHTAAGIDGTTTPDIRNVPIGHSTAIMNSWWGWRIPKESAQCRTSLLPKKEEGLEKVENWRPITVGNLYMRLYAKLWDKRLRQNVELDERQKGFVPVDGCFQNVKILQEIIKQQRKKRREYNFVFIDLAKAFDTVRHLSIEKGMRRKGIPEQVRSTVLEMYHHATTEVTVGGQTTRKIRINAGVKQGCRLSPLLFNLILDELLEKLKQTEIGVKTVIAESAVWLSQMIWF